MFEYDPIEDLSNKLAEGGQPSGIVNMAAANTTQLFRDMTKINSTQVDRLLPLLNINIIKDFVKPCGHEAIPSRENRESVKPDSEQTEGIRPINLRNDGSIIIDVEHLLQVQQMWLNASIEFKGERTKLIEKSASNNEVQIGEGREALDHHRTHENLEPVTNGKAAAAGNSTVIAQKEAEVAVSQAASAIQAVTDAQSNVQSAASDAGRETAGLVLQAAIALARVKTIDAEVAAKKATEAKELALAEISAARKAANDGSKEFAEKKRYRYTQGQSLQSGAKNRTGLW